MKSQLTPETANELGVSGTRPPEMRCIACGTVHEKATRDLRCPNCGDLLEIVYPGWDSSGVTAAELKACWRQRRTSNLGVDQSGVWRFREVLPPIGEGN